MELMFVAPYLAFDGLDSLIEYYIPLARDYPIAIVIYVLILALPIIFVVLILRSLRQRARDK